MVSKRGAPWLGVEVVSKEACLLVRSSSVLKEGCPLVKGPRGLKEGSLGQGCKLSQRGVPPGQEFF